MIFRYANVKLRDIIQTEYFPLSYLYYMSK